MAYPTNPKLLSLLDIEHPIILAPMFLVSNVKMITEALDAGITGAIPALNYRTDKEFREAISSIKKMSSKPFGINLIVNKSNVKYKEQLHTCLDLGVDYVITSLGSPKECIEEGRKQGMKVFCDVTNEKYAQKVSDLGADALIAVSKEAGGHAGKLAGEALIPLLKEKFDIPVISAGGVGNRAEFQNRLSLGADGCSIGSIFIATNESDVSTEYKQACVDYGAKDIVFTTRISGTPCTVINTPYVKEIGTKPSTLEKMMHRYKPLKKWIKLLIAYQGMKAVQKSAFQATYKTVWCAGPSIEHVHTIRDVKEVVKELV